MAHFRHSLTVGPAVFLLFLIFFTLGLSEALKKEVRFDCFDMDADGWLVAGVCEARLSLVLSRTELFTNPMSMLMSLYETRWTKSSDDIALSSLWTTTTTNPELLKNASSRLLPVSHDRSVVSTQ